MDEERHRILSDAGALVRLRSANPPGHERPVAEWLAARIRPVASHVALSDALSAADVDADDRANVVATFDFGPGPTFLLCSHLDVVPVQDEGQWDPVIRDGRLIGRGACDAKGAIAAMIAACERLTASPGDLAGMLLLACVADEESNAEGVRSLLARGLQADAAVIGEPTDNLVVLSSRGSVRLRVRFKGRAAHTSSPSQGVNAIYGAARFILAVESLDAELNRRGTMGSCSATVVSGGSKLNVVPEACSVEVDRRLGPAEAADTAVREIERQLARIAAEAPGISYELSPAGLWVDPFELATDGEFANRLLTALGQASPGPTFRAVSDAPHLIAAGIPTAILGPGSLDTAHSESEYVEISDLEAAVGLYERVVRAFLGAPDRSIGALSH